jgi:hypothetical protein
MVIAELLMQHTQECMEMCRESQLGLFQVLMHTLELRVSGENLKTCMRTAIASQGSIDHSAELWCPEVQ